MSEPTRLEDLRVNLMRLSSSTPANHTEADLAHRPASTADLVSALKAEGYIVIGRDENGWELPTYNNMVLLRTEAMRGLTPNGFKVLSQMERIVLAVVDALASRSEPKEEEEQVVWASSRFPYDLQVEIKRDGRRTDTAVRVAELLDKGMTVLKIARLLNISPQAVYRHINQHGYTLPRERARR